MLLIIVCAHVQCYCTSCDDVTLTTVDSKYITMTTAQLGKRFNGTDQKLTMQNDYTMNFTHSYGNQEEFFNITVSYKLYSWYILNLRGVLNIPYIAKL